MDQELVDIRHYLHQNPELSELEEDTADYIMEKLQKFSADKIIRNVGGHGVIAIYKGKSKGKKVAFRADLDALPIPEENEIEYRSNESNVAHLCGHDGHMTILLGFAKYLDKNRDAFDGEVVLLFQPAEETAQGAVKILNDENFKNLNIDYIFGLHNIPGYEMGKIILKNKTFASASTGFITRFYGKTSHAGHPENGINPAQAMISHMNYLQAIPQLKTSFNDNNLITLIHAKLGEEAFGTSPGYAEVMATIRSHKNEDLQKMIKAAEENAKGLADTYSLKVETELKEKFSAVNNHDTSFKIVEKAVNKVGYKQKSIHSPFSWSEDFGFYLEKYEGAFFGLGSGKSQPQLHNPDYDFPDELTVYGVNIFKEILEQISGR